MSMFSLQASLGNINITTQLSRPKLYFRTTISTISYIVERLQDKITTNS